jgi:transketolase
VIGKGAPNKQGTSQRTAPLGADEIAAARELGWNYPPFEIPADILADWRAAGPRARRACRLGRPPCRKSAEARIRGAV